LKPGKYYLCEFAVGNETPDGPHPFSRFFVGFLSKRKGPIGEAVVESGDGTGQIVPSLTLKPSQNYNRQKGSPCSSASWSIASSMKRLRVQGLWVQC